MAGCADRSSELSVVYRGDIAAYRTLVHVRLDTGTKARDVTPEFPSAAHLEKVATKGALPIGVSVLTPAGDTAARHTLAPLQLTPNTAYRLAIVIGRRPAAGRCDGAWVATPLARPLGEAPDSLARAESLYVSVSLANRTKPPRCDD